MKSIPGHKLNRVPPLLLALLLHVVPVCRTFILNPAAAQTGFAVIFRWVAGAGALLGAVDAVSGASAAISGLKPYVGTTQVGPTSLGPSIPAGAGNITLRIIVSNPGTNSNQAYWDCYPLPPGLTINTNYGASGYITNVPGQVTVEGVYPVTVLAGNQNFGYITTNATITVTNSGAGSAPSITGQPRSLTVTNGDPASFMVTASGSPAPAYKWRKNGTNLNGATLATYSILSTTTNDAGAYDVVVSNSSGSVTSSPPAILTVLVPPTITTQPQSLTVTNGDNAGFTVVASGVPAPTYQWRKDGTNISGATSDSYTITGVTTNDAGGYDVVVANAAGAITSSPPALLTVRTSTLLPLMLANMQMSGGVPTFDINGPANTNYVIWSSTNLSTWTSVSTNFTANGIFHFSDSGSPPANARFYRGTLGP
jgi:hypothetical protein